MYKISQEHRQLLLKYLSTRPYAEVFQLVALVVGLKPDTNSKDKDIVKLFDIADDLTYKSRRNFTLRHFYERINIYKDESFNYKIDRIKL